VNKTLGLLLLTLITISCKKEKDQIYPSPIPESTAPNYGMLTVGNYWVYERFEIDYLGVTTPMNVYDSCYISKDTIINGKTYYEMYRPNTYGSFYSYLRDSAGCIFDHYGRQRFSPTDFTSVFYIGYATARPSDTIAKGVFKMEHKDSLITVPSGNYVTSNAQTTCYMYPAWDYYYTTRYTNTCYAENIGIVQETLLLLFDKGFSQERKLIRYSAN
jgi:hypothetical protein